MRRASIGVAKRYCRARTQRWKGWPVIVAALAREAGWMTHRGPEDTEGADDAAPSAGFVCVEGYSAAGSPAAASSAASSATGVASAAGAASPSVASAAASSATG